MLSLSLSLSLSTQRRTKRTTRSHSQKLLSLSRMHSRLCVLSLLLLKRGLILTNARKKRKGEREKKSLGYPGFRERPSREREKSSTEKSDQTHHGDEFYLYERCERRLLLRLVVLARRREKRQWGFHWDGKKRREVVVRERFWSRKRERKSSREKNER